MSKQESETKLNNWYYRKGTQCIPENCSDIPPSECLKCETLSRMYSFKYGKRVGEMSRND